MDKVRFGRALGYGARHAARAMAQAVDAATSASPNSPVASAAGRNTEQRAAPPVASADRLRTVQKRVQTVSQAAGGIGRSVGAPVARFSRVLFLQVTGTFFTLIALVTGQALWVRRVVFRLGWHNSEAQKLYLLAAVFALFTYFAVSSFVRARRLERR